MFKDDPYIVIIAVLIGIGIIIGFCVSCSSKNRP
jgi:hypothetical protein